jgi:hypothetical protein
MGVESPWSPSRLKWSVSIYSTSEHTHVNETISQRTTTKWLIFGVLIGGGRRTVHQQIVPLCGKYAMILTTLSPTTYTRMSHHHTHLQPRDTPARAPIPITRTSTQKSPHDTNFQKTLLFQCDPLLIQCTEPHGQAIGTLACVKLTPGT